MARDRDRWADNLSAENTGGLLTGFLAEENELNRLSLWRLGSWGVASFAAVVVAVLATQYSVELRRDQIASADLMRQSQQIQWVAKESQNETRRLASAVDTLNNDRDRLYSRITVLEQSLDAVTGSIGRQNPAAALPAQAASTPSSTPATSAPASSALSTAAPSTSTPGAAQPTESLSVSQNTAPQSAAPTRTTAATADKASAVAALQPDPAAASLPPPSAPLPASPAARPEAPNAASSAVIAAPPATAIAAPATATAALATPAAPLMLTKSMMAPPDPAATKLTEPSANALPALPTPQDVASTSTTTEPDAAATLEPPAITVRRTEFGIDLGGANSVDGLRALWRGLLKYRSNKALADLRPIIVVKERTSGLGMQLRLVAGPLSDAAAAAKLCATLTENDRSCQTTVFDGQRLAMKSDDNGAPTSAVVSSGRHAGAPTRSSPRWGGSKGAKIEVPAAKAEFPKPSVTSLLGFR